MSSILIVDDDHHFRTAAKLVFELEGYEVSVAKSGAEAISLLKSSVPDAIIVDLKMPGINGIETIRQLKLINNCVPLIILTAYGTIPDAVEAVRCGAFDFIQKTAPYDELVALVKEAVASSYQGSLTPREIEILGWVKEGKGNEDIGAILDIAQSTVKAHMKSIFDKLSVTNRAQAVHAAIDQGILLSGNHFRKRKRRRARRKK